MGRRAKKGKSRSQPNGVPGRGNGTRDRRIAKRLEAGDRRAGCATLGLLLVGFFLFVFGLMFINLNGRMVLLWMYRDLYVRTEMEILDFDPRGDPATVVARVAADGEQLSTAEFGPGFYEPSGPGGIIGVAQSREKVIGRKIPIWYRADASRWISDLRVVAEHETMPTIGLVAKYVVLQLGFLVGGFLCLRSFYRRVQLLPAIAQVD